MRALIIVLTLAGACTPARAHQSLAPRRLELRLRPDRAVVIVRHELDLPTSKTLVERFDRDADGRLSEAEEQAAAAWISDRMRREIALSANGSRVALAVTSAALHLDGPRDEDGDVHAQVTLVLEAAWASGCPCAVELRDARVDAMPSVPLEITVEAGRLDGPGVARLTAASASWTGSYDPQVAAPHPTP